MTARVAPFPWFGGKARLSPHIVPLLPAHTVYCEPFGGAASVLFAKPRAPLEVYNDVHRGLVTFFRVLRDRPDDLQRALRLTPYSRVEYAEACDTRSVAVGDLETARQWYVAAWQSFGAHIGSGWAFQRNARDHESPLGTGRVRARSFVSAIEALPAFAERLRGVQVDCRPWREVVDLYEGRGALFYLDPPYHPETRSRTGQYEHEFTTEDHAEFVDRVTRIVGSVIVSGYDHPTYRPLEDAGFERIEIEHYTAVNIARGRPRNRVTEVLWRRAESRREQLSLLAA